MSTTRATRRFGPCPTLARDGTSLGIPASGVKWPTRFADAHAEFDRGEISGVPAKWARRF
jgi:hypothetical protein